MEGIKNLDITNEQMIIKYNLANLADIKINSNNYISFAFRPKNFFVSTLSFYFFRILYPIYNNSQLIFPIDSNFGNICQPEKNNYSEDAFYCYFSLYNNYNELFLKYSISSSNQIKDIKITNLYFKKQNNFILESGARNSFIMKIILIMI